MRSGDGELLQAIVRRFTGDDYIVHVAFAESRTANANEPRLLLQFTDGLAANISHTGAQSADQLMDHSGESATIGNPSLDAFRYQLRQAVLCFTLAVFVGGHHPGGSIAFTLRIPFAGPCCHRGE